MIKLPSGKLNCRSKVGKYKAEAVEHREIYAAGDRKDLIAEAQVSDLQARLHDATNQRKQLENKCNKLHQQVKVLEMQLVTAKKQLVTAK